MSKHTPAPWKLIDHDEHYIAITDLVQEYGVCELQISASENRETMKANACLIAAAPEMLKAIKDFYNRNWAVLGQTNEGRALIAAMDKAEGRK